jgi:hypothetical protein
MKATELRLGNWVKIGNIYTKIEGISTWDNLIQNSRFAERELNEFEPIPITEEILLKCEGYDKNYGFEINETTYLDFTIMGKWLYPYIIQEPEVSHLSTNCINLERIQHLHQLQNLFYALTGDELEINL